MSDSKILQKKAKCLNLGQKDPYLGIVWLEFQKNSVVFEISSLAFVKNEFFTHRVNFIIGPIFSKGPGSTFSQGLGPGPRSIYNVCCRQIS